MMPHELAEAVIEDIEKQIEVLSGSLAGGGASDYAEYKHITGRIRGLRSAVQTVKNLAKHTESDDD